MKILGFKKRAIFTSPLGKGRHEVAGEGNLSMLVLH
jgi:hypothetical protein